MHHRRALLLSALVGALLLVAAAAPFAAAQPAPVSRSSAEGISVVGEGIVLTRPDAAVVTLGVEVTNLSLAAAQAEAARRMDAVVQKVKAAGVPDERVRTVSFRIQPQYGQDGGLRGYLVQNLVEVRTTDLAGLGSLLDDVVSVGASRVQGIHFEAEDVSRLKSQAREQAMQNAREKADQLARLAGVTLGRPLVIAEADAGGVTPLRAELARPAAALAAPTPIEPGELQVRTTVQVIWAIQ